MERRLGEFVGENADGWGHREWRSLLATLEREGHDVSRPEAIGMELERLRLRRLLEGLDVRGLGPKRTGAVVERFGRLWEARQASVESLASVPSLNRSVARALYQALH